MAHEPVTTMAELDEMDGDEIYEGYRSAEAGDPEPGMNHTRAFHHGWRVRQMDRGAMPIPEEHRALVRAYLQRDRERMGLRPD